MTKEVRALLAPAALTLGATGLAWWIGRDTGLEARAVSRWVADVAFFIGIPLIAATPIGSEFQQHTLTLLLAQPIARSRLWVEKCVPVALLITVIAAVQLISLRGELRTGAPTTWFVLFAAMAVCSSAFWTLVARSTIGGIAFSLSAMMLLELAGGFAVERLSGGAVRSELLRTGPLFDALRLFYCAATMVFGYWTFSAFQVTSEPAGSATQGLALPTPRALECRSKGALANLFRVELRLQRPTFMVAALFTLCWLAALVIFPMQPSRLQLAEWTLTTLVVVYLPLGIVLAGAISVGEEAAFGLHESRLMLPIRTGTQWLVKLAAALGVAAIAVFALPAVLALLASAAFGLRVQHSIPIALLSASAAVALTTITVLSFWSATVFGNTVRAAIATCATVLVLGFVLLSALMAAARWRLAKGLLTWVMVRYQLPPDAFGIYYSGGIAISLALATIVGVALAQSFHAFRRIHVDSAVIARYAIGLLVAPALVVFSVATFTASAVQFGSTPVRELVGALQAISAGDVSREEHHVTVDELARAGRLSPSTRAWIAGSEISVRSYIAWVPANGSPSRPRPTVSLRRFEASLTFPNGRHCTLYYFAD